MKMSNWTKMLPFFIIEMLYKKWCEPVTIDGRYSNAYLLWDNVLIIDKETK